IVEPLRWRDQRDRLRAVGEIGRRTAERLTGDLPASGQGSTANLALRGFVDTDRRIIEAVATLQRRAEAREPADRRAEHEIARPLGRRIAAYEVDEPRLKLRHCGSS